jgi:hypothetical protein
MCDGETRELAPRNIVETIAAWIDEPKAFGRPVQAPSMLRLPEAKTIGLTKIRL